MPAIFFLLGADFVGATQILVYVGGTLVLVVFGVMLTAQGPFINMKSSPAEWAISAVVGCCFWACWWSASLGTAAPGQGPVANFAHEVTGQAGDSKTRRRRSRKTRSMPTPLAWLSGRWRRAGHTENRDGQNRCGCNYLLPFEIVSVHLLVVLIGAAYLARAKRRRRVEA